LRRVRDHIIKQGKNASDAMACLRVDLGSRTESAGAMSLFEQVNALAKSQEELSGIDLDSTRQDMQNAVLNVIFMQLKKELKPVVDFAAYWSSSEKSPGDHLQRHIQDLTTQLE